MKKAVLFLASVVLLLASAAWAEDARSISEGRALYNRHCTGCHGALGVDEYGNPVSSRGLGINGTRKAPDLTLIAARDGSFNSAHVWSHITGFTTGQNRDRTMPVWIGHLSHEYPTGDSAAILKASWLTKYLESVQETNPLP